MQKFAGLVKRESRADASEFLRSVQALLIESDMNERVAAQLPERGGKPQRVRRSVGRMRARSWIRVLVDASGMGDELEKLRLRLTQLHGGAQPDEVREEPAPRIAAAERIVD